MCTKLGEFVSVASVFVVLLQLAPAFGQSYGTDNPYFNSNSATGQPPYPSPGQTCYAPAGMSLSASLLTSISTDVAKPGDLVQATLSQPVILSSGQIPAGSMLIGHVASATAGGFLGKSGRLTINFDHLRMPNGIEIPMSAHIMGELGKYKQSGNGSDSFVGETGETKVGQALLRTAIGAGTGAALGTAVGAIAGHGNNNVSYSPVYGAYGYRVAPMGYYPSYRNGTAVGAGRGAWSGAAIGGGVGLADSLLLRKGKNIEISSGTPIQLQLDAPMMFSSQIQFGRM